MYIYMSPECLPVCIYLHVYTVYTFMQICMYLYTHIHIYIYTCIYIHIQVSILLTDAHVEHQISYVYILL